MMQFIFTNDQGITGEQKEDAKKAWIDKLGIFREEFEEKNGFITIDFVKAKDDRNYFVFTFPEHSISDFVQRFNEWQKAGRPVPTQ